MSSDNNKEEYYAGIDVGTTGIKLSILGAELNPKTKKLEFWVAKKSKMPIFVWVLKPQYFQRSSKIH